MSKRHFLKCNVVQELVKNNNNLPPKQNETQKVQEHVRLKETFG